ISPTIHDLVERPSTAPARYTLSLHDALPICKEPLDRHLVGRIQYRRRQATSRRRVPRHSHCGVPRRIDRLEGQRPEPSDVERGRSEEHTSELQSRENLVCRLLLEKKKLSPQW